MRSRVPAVALCALVLVGAVAPVAGAAARSDGRSAFAVKQLPGATAWDPTDRAGSGNHAEEGQPAAGGGDVARTGPAPDRTRVGVEAAGGPAPPNGSGTNVTVPVFPESPRVLDANVSTSQVEVFELDSAGRPHVVYYEGSRLLYAWGNGTDWHTETVASGESIDDLDPGAVGLTLDGDGDPHVTYPVEVNDTGVLWYAHREGGTWTRERVDPRVRAGAEVESTVAVDGDGTPHVVYYEGQIGSSIPTDQYERSTFHFLTYATREDGTWSRENAMVSRKRPEQLTMVLDDGTPTVATYARGYYSDVVRILDPDGPGNWEERDLQADVDPASVGLEYEGSLGSWNRSDVRAWEYADEEQIEYLSFALGEDGRRHLAYSRAYDYGQDEVLYAFHNGTGWNESAVAVASTRHEDVGRFTDVAVDGAGRPHVVYDRETDDGRRLAYALRVNGSWTTRDAARMHGRTRSKPRLALHDGDPRIVYVDEPSGGKRLSYLVGRTRSIRTPISTPLFDVTKTRPPDIEATVHDGWATRGVFTARNVGTEAGVAVLGIKYPADAEFSLPDPEYGDVEVVYEEPGLKVVTFELSALESAHQPYHLHVARDQVLDEDGNYSIGDRVRVYGYVLAQVPTDTWRRIRNRTTKPLERLRRATAASRRSFEALATRLRSASDPERRSQLEAMATVSPAGARKVARYTCLGHPGTDVCPYALEGSLVALARAGSEGTGAVGTAGDSARAGAVRTGRTVGPPAGDPDDGGEVDDLRNAEKSTERGGEDLKSIGKEELKEAREKYHQKAQNVANENLWRSLDTLMDNLQQDELFKDGNGEGSSTGKCLDTPQKWGMMVAEHAAGETYKNFVKKVGFGVIKATVSAGAKPASLAGKVAKGATNVMLDGLMGGDVPESAVKEAMGLMASDLYPKLLQKAGVGERTSEEASEAIDKLQKQGLKYLQKTEGLKVLTREVNDDNDAGWIDPNTGHRCRNTGRWKDINGKVVLIYNPHTHSVVVISNSYSPLARGYTVIKYQVNSDGTLKGSEHNPLKNKEQIGDGQELTGSPEDPNHLTGTPNVTYVRSDRRLTYTVQFENKPNATAPASRVAIESPLDEDLDESSLSVLGSSHPASVAGTAVENGTLEWVFRGIGLPPNEEPPEGQGWVRFSVRPADDVETGDEIDARASIVFDQNRPIATNEVTYVIDDAAPGADVAATELDASGGSVTYRVEVTGDDGESGTERVRVYVAEDGGNYSLNRTIRGRSGNFTVEVDADGAYAVSPVAVDAVGNRGEVGETELELPKRTETTTPGPGPDTTSPGTPDRTATATGTSTPDSGSGSGGGGSLVLGVLLVLFLVVVAVGGRYWTRGEDDDVEE